MLRKLNTVWDRRTIRRIAEITVNLAEQYEWFSALAPAEQFRTSIQFQNAQKIGLQRYKIAFADMVPLIVSTIALCAALFR